MSIAFTILTAVGLFLGPYAHGTVTFSIKKGRVQSRIHQGDKPRESSNQISRSQTEVGRII